MNGTQITWIYDVCLDNIKQIISYVIHSSTHNFVMCLKSILVSKKWKIFVEETLRSLSYSDFIENVSSLDIISPDFNSIFVNGGERSISYILNTVIFLLYHFEPHLFVLKIDHMRGILIDNAQIYKRTDYDYVEFISELYMMTCFYLKKNLSKYFEMDTVIMGLFRRKRLYSLSNNGGWFEKFKITKSKQNQKYVNLSEIRKLKLYLQELGELSENAITIIWDYIRDSHSKTFESKVMNSFLLTCNTKILFNSDALSKTTVISRMTDGTKISLIQKYGDFFKEILLRDYCQNFSKKKEDFPFVKKEGVLNLMRLVNEHNDENDKRIKKKCKIEAQKIFDSWFD